MSQFSLDRQGPKVTVKMCAELTAPMVSELRDLLDAAGLSLLLAARNSFQGQRAFKLAAVQPQLFSILETLRLDRSLNAQTG